MNNVDDNVLNIIYKYKHHLEYVAVMNELCQARVFTRYNVSLAFCLMASFFDKGKQYKCIDIDKIDTDGSNILKVIHNMRRHIK